MRNRSLYYACIQYEDSMPENSLQILEDLHIPCLVSPLHNADINADGTPKKNHRHILFLFESLKSKKQFQEISSKINGVGAEIVVSPKAYALYLAHENAPDKAQYNPEDIIALSGAYEYLEKLHKSSINRDEVIIEIIRFCQSENIDCLADIIEYSLDNFDSKPEWFHVLSEGSSSIMLTNYLKSRTWRKTRCE